MNPYKSMGTDDMHPRVPRELADMLTEILSIIFERSQLSDKGPGGWEKENITPIYKKERKEYLGDYRPVSLTSVQTDPSCRRAKENC